MAIIGSAMRCGVTALRLKPHGGQSLQRGNPAQLFQHSAFHMANSFYFGKLFKAVFCKYFSSVLVEPFGMQLTDKEGWLLLLSPFSRWEAWGTRRWSNLPKAVSFYRAEVGIQPLGSAMKDDTHLRCATSLRQLWPASVVTRTLPKLSPLWDQGLL